MNSNSILIAIIGIGAIVLIVLGLTVILSARKKSSLKLREKFGPEYDLALEKSGDQRLAEVTLKEREKRVSSLEIHDLSESERNRYHGEWVEIQTAFVDDPSKSVEEAHRLITEVMIARGFPVVDFEQRAEDLSVLYPNLVTNYRSANAITLKNQSSRCSTEEIRQAMVNYRSLFEELLGAAQAKEVVVPGK